MSLSTQPAASGSKTIASSALRRAGLMDRDATMRDGTDNAGGRKGRTRSGKAARMLDINRDKPSGSRPQTIRFSTSATNGHSSQTAIRGASSRPTLAGRIRRNAVSGDGESSTPSRIPVKIMTPKPVEAWRELVKKRWNPETKFLNLDSMLEDEVVKKYNLNPPGNGGTGRDAAVIFKLAGQLKPEVETLSLANNKLTGMLLIQLGRYLPSLLNLSVQNNSIRDKKELGMFIGTKDKFTKLRELVLVGNPVHDAALKHNDTAAFRADVARRIPTLQVLDQDPITQISFDAPQATPLVSVAKPNATTFPVEMGPAFVTGVDGSLVSNFLIRYFQAFDNQRDALVFAYDGAATFSFSANTAIPTRARITGYHSSREMPNQRKLEWGSWLEAGSRNLNRIGSDANKTISNLHIGGEQIVKVLTVLPPTRHDINGPPEKFCLDAFPVPHGQNMGLLVTLHGQFTEVTSGGIRSFDRTMMLVPTADGSGAKLNGWDVTILSDQWIIRSYSSHEAWKPGPMLVQAESTKPKGGIVSAPSPQPPQPFNVASLPPDQQAALATLPETRQNLVIQVCAQTNLNAKYAHDCLNGNEWDFNRAMANFNNVKASLPRDAFL
ncbi:hypothetical protein CPB83DRAFT_903528 [Crepidotus variabilis]|uniref:mRNA export factor MEX67 n=1 Tax=Crepidotus variabilis TaxID=179855 RepID=A0A9P6EPV0_9AGAR|nr:hypothetical protein CPB83DRAFT_903528 [Crepidotus variabilis]